jgi:hypothetical protein
MYFIAIGQLQDGINSVLDHLLDRRHRIAIDKRQHVTVLLGGGIVIDAIGEDRNFHLSPLCVPTCRACRQPADGLLPPERPPSAAGRQAEWNLTFCPRSSQRKQLY